MGNAGPGKTLPRNQLAIDRARAVDGRPTVYRVTDVPGLELYVSVTGARTWRVRYQVGHGRKRVPRRYTIGDARAIKLGQATAKAMEVIAAARLDSRDPHAEKTAPAGDTFGAVVEQWIEKHGRAHKRSWQDDEALYKRHIEARLGRRPLSEIDRAAIIAVLDDVAAGASGIQANRCQSLISAVFSWAVDEGHVESHPAVRIRKRAAETHRARLLSHDELRTIWHGVAKMSPQRCAAVRLLMLTGQRRSEIVEAERSELDLQAATLSIRAERRKGWRLGKPPLPHVVYLPPPAVTILRETLAAARYSKFVFPNRTVKNDTPMVAKGLSSRFGALAASLGLEDVRLHDLRHAVKTGMAQLGVPPHVADRVQDHADARGAGAIYDHNTYAAEKRRALELWSARMMEIVEDRPASGLKW